MARNGGQNLETELLEHRLLDVLDSLERVDEEHTPITRLPHLDVFTHDSKLPLPVVAGDARDFPLPLDNKTSYNDGRKGHSPNILTHLYRYANFISGVTGQDNVSIWCTITTALRKWHGIIVAEQPLGCGNPGQLRVVESSTSLLEKIIDITDFSFHFNYKSIGDWHESSSTHIFSVMAVAAQCYIKVSGESMPKPAIKSLLYQLQHEIAGSEYSVDGFSDKNMSVLSPDPMDYQIKTGLPASADLFLHEMFDVQARQTPDHCAIEFLRPEISRESTQRLRTWTYRQLNDRCNSLATYLQAILNADHLQRSQQRVVPVYLSTSPELYISYLAILKAGYAFCPLPTDAPAQRLKDILGDIKPLVVLGAGSAPDSGPWHEVSRAFDLEWLDVWRPVDCPREISVPRPKADGLAYLMYTSGSSGKPKGVQITHHAATASVVAHIEQYRKTMPENVPMRWYQFAASTFDPSIMEIFVTLCCGGTLCSAPRGMTLSSPEAAITETRSTIMMATPGFASILDVDRIPTLRCLWTMGETLNRRVIERFAHPEDSPFKTLASNRTFPPNLHLCNAYGPTEAAVNVTFFPNVRTNIRGSIIGYPLCTTSILVIDSRGHGIKPVPLGFVGELVIRGIQLSSGYLQQPNADFAAFVNDEHYGRIYRTGDRARVVWDAKGMPLLEYLGRLSDEQVKVNGQRVELEDIESALCTVPEVQGALIVPEKPAQIGRNGVLLVAYLLLDPTAKLSWEYIKEKCRETTTSRLPSHMQPAELLFVSQLPRTAAGKIDRKEMARVASRQRELRRALSRKETTAKFSQRESLNMDQEAEHLIPTLERALQKIVGPSDSASKHLKYWLDSLSALRFLRYIKDQGIEMLSLKDILHARSIADLAQVAVDRSKEQRSSVNLEGPLISASLSRRLDDFRIRWQGPVQKHLGVAEKDILDVLPTTATQERILLSFSISRYQPTESRKYVHHSVHNFARDIGIRKLKAAWSKVINRHDVYRTVFVPVDDDSCSFAQVVLPPGSHFSQIRWIEGTSNIDCLNSDNVDVINAARKADSMVDLENSLPALTLIKTPNHLSILLSMLHAIFDFGSLKLLLEEIAADLEGQPPPFRRELRLAAETYFVLQNQERDVFWDDYMHDYEPLPFPSLNSTRPEMILGTTASSQVTSMLTMDGFQNRARNLLCSPLSALQAAWSAILLAYTSSSSSDIAFGSLFANRSEHDREFCVGPTFSIIPTRIRFGPSTLNIDILRALTNGNYSANHHLNSTLCSGANYVPSYDTTIALQVFQQGDDSCQSLWQNMVTLPMAHDYAVMIEAIPDARGQISLKATYADSYLNQNSAKVMLSQLDEILIWILANPMLPFRDSSDGLKADRLSILNADPRTESVANSLLLHSQFELNAREHGNRTALEYHYSLENTPGSAQRWSYSELNAEADELAAHIRSRLGDVTGTIIPIMMDKRPELYSAVLGVLKAGEAWSPIDTSSPAVRRQGLIARLGSKLILVPQDAIVDNAGIPDGVEVVTVPRKGSVVNNSSPKESRHDRRDTTPSLAYLIWTSGTTGEPKGVLISHKAASASMKAIQTAIPCKTRSGDTPRSIQFSQHTFDVFVQDLFLTWGVGGTVISASREIMTSAFADLSRMTKASHAYLTPAFAATVKRDSCPTLEVVTMIGEKLPQHVADDWGRDMKAYNTYGPAEATVVSTVGEFSGSGGSIKSSNIGRPLPSISCYILRDGKNVMIQGIGELAIGGPQLARGYLNDPGRTSAKFIIHGHPEKLLYLTGDIVRQLADGTLDFIGREDDLVKLGGIRVELSEISFVMKDCHKLIGQIETCYVARADRPEGVVSFIAANFEHKKMDRGQPICTPEAVEIARCAMNQAQLSLPNYMVPSTIVILQNIPTTSSAKIDRKALEKAYKDLDLNFWEAATSAGRTETSEDQELSGNGLKVRQCLAEFSHVPFETIYLHSSLHSLGIDSLNAARFVHRLTKFDITLRITDLLQSQTIHDVLRTIGKSEQEITIQNRHMYSAGQFSKAWLPHVQSCLDQDINFVMPVTSLQEGVLSESMLNKSSYWSNHLFRLDPNVAVDRLRSAWELVCSNTEALRMSFVTLAEVARSDLSSPCPSSFLQTIYNEIRIDWAEFVAVGNLRDVAQERTDHIMSHHQKTTFRHPPWAVTTMKDESGYHMMLTIHHAIYDTESIKYIMSDLASAYSSLIVPQRYQVRDALPFSLNYDGYEADEIYWRNTLEPYADIGYCPWPDLIGTEVPINKAMPRSMISETYELGLSLEEVAHATRTLGTSFSVILKVAFGCLLLNYLETPAVVFTEIVSQRVRNPCCGNAIAPLVAGVPVPFVSKRTTNELLSEQSRQAAQSWAHGSPSGPLVRKLLRRSPHQQTYPAVFVFHGPRDEIEGEQASQSALWHQDEDVFDISVEYDLSLNVYSGEGWRIELTADNRIMRHESLKTFCLQIEALTQAILRSPNRPLLGLLDNLGQDVISRAESKLPEPPDHPCNVNPTYWLEYHAQHHADWNAVEVATNIEFEGTETKAWSFRTLIQESRKIARLIKERHHRGVVIAMCTGRTLQSYAIIVGIFMSGNTYLPIDDGLPRQRKLLLLEDSDCVLLFTDSTCIKGFGSGPLKCSIIDVDNTSIARQLLQTSDAACPPPDPSEAAYLLYTSGSTGKPKGVLISHRSLCGFVEGLTNFMGLCSALTKSQARVGKWLGLASRAFDVHLAEIFLAWRSGLAAVTAPREVLLDDLRLALTSLKVTHACFVPSLLEQAELTPNQLPNFVFMTIGGEKISKRIVNTWAGHPSITAVNAYGPTELAIGCSASHVVPNFNISNIGFPYGNTVAHILVPETPHYAIRGQVGELCFTGCLVGNGYLNRPDAKGFVEDFRGQRMYRTGDMARMLPDGSLVFLGRRDDQTKIRGQRMELSEISETIRASGAGTLEVVTLLVDHPGLPGNFLTSFVSDMSKRAKRYDAKPILVDTRFGEFSAHINEHCKKVLPLYMVPDYVIPVDIIPLARVSGKADMKTLKTFFASLPVQTLLGTLGQVSPGNVQRKLSLQEEQVAAVVKDVLHIGDRDSILAAGNLFGLGLDSLNAIGIMVKLRDIGLHCSLNLLLGYPTVESIATRGDWSSTIISHHQQSINETVFRTLRDSVLSQQDLRISKEAVEKVLPCLPIQESTITATLNSGNSRAYINSIVFELEQDTDMYRFKKAWLDLIEYTPILRTTFHLHQDNFVQVLLRSHTILSPWMEIDIDQKDSVRDVLPSLLEEVNHDISSTIQERPPLRLHLIRKTTGRQIFLVTIHHSLYDGHSFDMMMEDLWLRYQNQGIPHRTAFETMLEYNAAQDVQSQESFWTQYLAGGKPTHIKKQEMMREEISASTRRSVQPKLSCIRQVANRLEATLATFSQCLFAVAFARKTKSSDIMFGSVLSGRSVPVQGAESIRAPCITTIPQRIRFQPDDTLSRVTSRVQSMSTKCMEYQHTSLRDISRWTHLEQPMFEALFTFRYNETQEEDSRPWMQVKSSMFTGYPLAVEFTADNSSDSLVVTCEYTSAFGIKEDAESLVDDIEILLTMISNGEDPKISRLGIVEQDFARKQEARLWDETFWSVEEITMRDVLQDITRLEPGNITKNSSYFQLGIDSVSAIRFAKILREKHLSVSSADVMRYPCIGSLSHHLSNQAESTLQEAMKPHPAAHESLRVFVNDVLKIPVDSLESVYSCTPLQAGMITTTLVSRGTAYVHRHIRNLPPEVDIERLRKAWAMTLESSDILRTSFHYTTAKDSNWIACVHRKVTTGYLDCYRSSEPFAAVAPFGFLKDEDFAKPPIQATLCQDDKQIVFQLTMHHALYDGISLPMIFERFSLAYLCGSLEASQVPPFYDATQIISKTAAQSTGFWLATIEGYSNMNIHILSDDAPRQAFSTRKCSVSPETVIKQCKNLGVTLQTVLLAAYSKVLATVLGRRDITFGHVVSGRSLPIENCESIIGPLFNTVPFRIRLDHLLSSNSEMMDTIQNLTTKAQVHQHASLAQIQDEWRKREGCGGTRLFDSIFLFQKVASSAHNDFFRPLEDRSPVTPSEYCLNVEVEQSETELMLSASCHEGCLKDRSLDSFLEMYEEVLHNLLEHPAHAIGSHPSKLAALPLGTPKSESTRTLDEGREPREDSNLQKMKEILGQVSEMPVENIASTTSIFALGLTSLSAIAVAAECRRQGLNLSVADVLQGVTAKGICNQMIRTTEYENSEKEVTTRFEFSDLLNSLIDEECIECILPALSGQTYHLNAWLRSARTMYMPTWSYTCSSMNISRLQHAWTLLQERHQILRTTFAALSSTNAAQIILKPSAIDGTNFSSISGAVDEEAIQQRVKEQQKQATDLKTPPVRIQIIQGPSHDVMLLTIHHALYDAWSLPILISDLAKLYNATTLSNPPNWQQFVKQTTRDLPATSSAAQFWHQALHPCDQTLITRRPPTPHSPPSTPTQTFISLPQALTNLSPLTSTRPHAIPLSTLFLLSFARSLATLTATKSPIFGTYSLGRSASIPGTAQLAAPTLNVLPLVVRDPWAERWHVKAQEIQTALAARMPFEQASLVDVVRWGGGEGDGAEDVAFNAFVNVLWGGGEEGRVRGEGGGGEGEMFKVMDVGVPSDFVPEAGVEIGGSGLEELRWPGVGEGIFVDVAVSRDGESVDVGARVEGGVLGEEEAREWLRGIVEGVREMLEEK